MQISPQQKILLEALSNYVDDVEEVGERLLNFCILIEKSNKLHNLTSVKGLDDMIIKHLLDSLSIKNLLIGKKILDIGSGAGLPSIPLAFVCPAKNFFLLDSNNKKIIFLNHAKINLSLENIRPIHERIENYNNEKNFDTVVCRSYASLSTIYSNSKKNLKDKGIIIAMKGKYPYKEITEFEALHSGISFNVKKLNVPGLKAERHAVIINKT